MHTSIRIAVSARLSKILHALLASAAISLTASGCVSIPHFEREPGTAQDDDTVGPTVSELVTHIQCEIFALHSTEARQKDKILEVLWSNVYVVNVNLTLDVTDNEGLSPTLNFIKPLASSQNRTLSIGGQITGQQHRNINLVFTLYLDGVHFNAERARKCKPPEGNATRLKGDLGIKEVVIAGLKHVSSPDFIFPVPIAADQASQRLKTPSFNPTFGSTIDFTLVRSIGGGPTLTLTHFRGPQGGTNLVNYMRTVKDTLVISFATSGPPDKPEPGKIGGHFMRPLQAGGSSDIDQAVKAAQDNSTRMILQRLLP